MPKTLMQQYGWEFTLTDDYLTRIHILRSWALSIERLVTEKRIAGNKRLVRMLRAFMVAAHSVCDWKHLIERDGGTLGTIRRAYVRCGALV